ncbi:MAG TPA: Crp/Fnr family transcriptional regulator [Cyclobacteriaceae bacterium]|nr:Crp/Fnr family transcriptional regulator [Cyclobacteriaceae bacterium]
MTLVSMFDKLIECIQEKVDLSESDVETLKQFFVPKKVRKRQYILNAGDVCQYITFVEKGMLRSFTVDEAGNEYVVQFAIEGWWVSDVGSFMSGDNALYNIEALEDCELLQLSKSGMEDLLVALPVMKHFFGLLMQNNIAALQRRFVAYMSLSAEKKYLRLMEVAPEIIQRASRQHIASYLSITPETLSRVRKKVAERDMIGLKT